MLLDRGKGEKREWELKLVLSALPVTHGLNIMLGKVKMSLVGNIGADSRSSLGIN